MINQIKNSLIPGFFMATLMGSLLISSCQTEELCEELTANPLRVGLYYISDADTILTSVDSITVYGIGRPNDLIYENDSLVQMMELPMNPSTDTLAFVFIFPEATDTLQVSYERQTLLISVECGFVVHYTILSHSISNNYVLEMEVNNLEITNTADEHIRIFIPGPAIPVPDK